MENGAWKLKGETEESRTQLVLVISSIKLVPFTIVHMKEYLMRL